MVDASGNAEGIVDVTITRVSVNQGCSQTISQPGGGGGGGIHGPRAAMLTGTGSVVGGGSSRATQPQQQQAEPGTAPAAGEQQPAAAADAVATAAVTPTATDASSGSSEQPAALRGSSAGVRRATRTPAFLFNDRLYLRADADDGETRLYVVGFRATDAKGQTCTGRVEVVVAPREAGGGAPNCARPSRPTMCPVPVVSMNRRHRRALV